MKRCILAVAILLTLGCGAHAVELKQGWYAKFGYVGLLGGLSPQEGWGTDWSATSPTGVLQPLLIEQGDLNYFDGRMITVTEDKTVETGVLWEDTGFNGNLGPYCTYFQLNWHTNYDGSQIRLQAVRRRTGQADTLLWTQSLSGEQYGSGQMFIPGKMFQGDSLVFQLVAVPEPSALISLVGGLAGCLVCWKKRRTSK